MKPLDGGRGPTRSTCTMPKRASGVANVARGASVACTPGCESECRLSNIARLNEKGTTGRGTPVEVANEHNPRRGRGIV